ncbi:hypothetical protein LTR66_005789 [Elasticomyces elasticus]|nr:hypothetical protein LTR66_005789 [Elasticomyces elasticus]
MADEQNITDSSPDTAPTLETEKTTADAGEATVKPHAEPSASDPLTTEVVKKKEDVVAVAGEQATTEVNPPDGEGTTEVADDSFVATTNAPGSNKNGKRKSSAGVPEHKTKKIQKKKSIPNGMNQLNLDAKPGEFYWARLRGYPPWPSVICDEDMLPESLLSTRPVSTARVDGSYREDFMPSGKNYKDRTFPVMFLGTNEFSWMLNTALTPLHKSEVEGATQGKKSKSLFEAYEVAAKGPTLDDFKELLTAHEEAIMKDMEERKAKAAQKEEQDAKKKEKVEQAKEEKSKAKKPSRKSKDAAVFDEDVDMEDAAAETKPSKKRKKEADSDGDVKPKKTPKSVKLSAPKTPNGDSSTKKPKSSSKPKKTVAKPKAESEEEEEKSEAPVTEVERLQKRERAVLYLRHRLQKGFLSRDQAPKEEEMASMSDFFSQLEGYSDLEASIIRTTKIHKVLKAIVKLNSIPKDEELGFKKRSYAILDSWSKVLDQDTGGKVAEMDSKVDMKVEAEKSSGKKAKALKDAPAVKEEVSAAPVEATEPGNDASDDGDVTMKAEHGDVEQMADVEAGEVGTPVKLMADVEAGEV